MAIDKSDYGRVFATVFAETETLLLSAKQQPDHLPDYLQSWENCAEKAAELENFPLQDIIFLFTDACRAVLEKNISLTDEQWNCLKTWQSLFASYINAPDNQHIILDLIKCLNYPALALELQPEDELMLLDCFLPIINQLTDHEQTAAIKETITEELSIWEKLAILFKETDLRLQEILTQSANNADEIYSESLKQYLESWRVIAHAVEIENNTNVAKLFDSVLLFIDFSSQLFNQNERLNHDQQTLLTQWHQLFNQYIQLSGSRQLATDLINCLKNPLWLQPLSNAQANNLLAELSERSTSDIQSAYDDFIKAAAQDSLEFEQIPVEEDTPTPLNAPTSTAAIATPSISIWQSLNQYFIATVLNLKAIVTAQTEEAFTAQVQAYQQNWQHIVEIIKTDKQQAGLLDIVLLFIEITSPAFEKIGLNNQYLARLKKWHGLFDNYIKDHGDQQFILPLIKCLSDPFWPSAIAAEDEAILLTGFKQAQNQLQSSVAMTAQTEEMAFENASAMPAMLENATVSSEPLLTSTDSANHLIAPLNSEIAQPTVAEPLITEKTSLWQQIESLFDETCLNLNATAECLSQHDAIALKESLQTYLESWLAIAQQIEIDDQQLGLLDLVLLFIEVTRQAFEKPRNIDEQHILLLNQWQNLFSDFFKTSNNRQQAIALITCLSSPLWSGAIEPEDEAMLLAGFNFSTELPSASAELPTQSQEIVGTSTDSAIEQVAEHNIADIIDAAIANDFADTDFSGHSSKELLWHDIESTFHQATVLLKAAIDSEIVDDKATFKQSLQDYTKCWQNIADHIATDDNLLGLFDVILLFTEISKCTFARLENLSSEQFALLSHWQKLFVEYFVTEDNAQFAIGLVKCLSNPLWSEPIKTEDEPMLLAGLGIEDSAEIIALTEVEPETVIDIPLKPEKHPLWQKLECFFNEAQAEISLMQECLKTNKIPVCSEYAAQYSNHWSVIAEMLAEDDEALQSLADITFLFADNCAELVEQNNTFTAEILQLLQQWHYCFTNYLQDVTAILRISALIECLEDSHWLRPLTTVDKEMLLEIFTEDQQQQSLFAVEEENPFSFDDELFAAEETEEFALFADDSMEEEPITLATEEFEETEIFANEALAVTTTEALPLFAEETTEEASADLLMTAASTVVEELPTQPAISVNPELIGMVRDEFTLLVDELTAENIQQADTTAFKIILRNHEFKFENLTKACNTIGLFGLEQVFAQLSLNMRSRRDDDIFTETEADLFKAALPLIQNYIGAINEKHNAIALVAHLSMPGWKQPLTETQTKSLLNLLSRLVLGSNTQKLENRKTVAEANDVSLELPKDVNRDLLDSLLNELPVLTGNFSTVIQEIISGSDNVQKLLEAQRIAHTLKGSGNIVGVAGIAVLTHHLEEILEYLTEHQTFPTKALAAVLLESADCLEMMTELMLNSETEPPEQALQVLQNVLLWANQIASSGLPTEDAQLTTATLPVQSSGDIAPVISETKATEAIAMTRVPSSIIDHLLRMTGEGSILSEQFKERIKRFSQELKMLNDLTWQMQSLVSELDQSINIQSHTAKTNRGGVNNGFDALEMEQYNELHTAASRIAEVATDIREINIHMDEQLVELKYLMVEEDAVQKENQEMVQSIRMVPANTIASRCHRIVRQACRATNKEVELEIKGADILIDSEILNDMVEPLMHLLRNSVDHGIEPVHIREKFNKPKVGKITLEFSRKGNYAVITCKDDGGGLASGNILQTAIKKGLISAKQQLSDAEIHKLILIPGFSTRAVVTQTSGRGIGMDAIQTKISSIQGQMSLFSTRGEGLTIEITIPLTLSSMLSLLVKCGGQIMAISNRGLRKIHHADECQVEQIDGQLYCDIDYKRYPAKYFSELVGIPITYRANQKLQALRIEDEIGRTHIVFVEELLGYRDLLVKNMGSYIPHIQGVTGASILGNGDVAPVIDLVEMLHHAAKYDYVLADATKALADNINGLPVALVVDDSLSARRSVAMLLKDSGLEVETAIDGLDAIKHIEKAIPDIILVDLEMPRMNGIELTAHVRNREDLKETPIIMITSRATEKHRKQAEAAGVTRFMTKPFTEDELVNSVRMLVTK